MLNDRLKLLLNDLHMSQRQFAMRINLDAGYFSKIIQGKSNPPERILLLIESVFHVNPSWLERGEGEMYIEQNISLARKQVMESIQFLNDEQIKAVSAFIRYLTENTEKDNRTLPK